MAQQAILASATHTAVEAAATAQAASAPEGPGASTVQAVLTHANVNGSGTSVVHAAANAAAADVAESYQADDED